MTLIDEMPRFHIKAIEISKKSGGKKKSKKGKDGVKYMCPVYIYPIRAGTTEDPSYMFSVPLKSGKGGKIPVEYW